MKVRGLILLSILLVTSGCSGTAVRTAKKPATVVKTTRPIVAQVVDEAGTPVAGAKVTAVVVYDAVRGDVLTGTSGVTDEDGEAYLDEFLLRPQRRPESSHLYQQPPMLMLVASVPGQYLGRGSGGYATAVVRSYEILTSDRLYKERILASKLVACRGRVKDEKGWPIAGVQVSPIVGFASSDPESAIVRRIAGIRSTTTDSSGAYALPHCPLSYGSQKLSFAKPGYVPLDQKDAARVVLQRAGGMTGRLVDCDRKPVDGNYVLLRGPRESLLTTAPSGMFEAQDLAPGAYAVEVLQDEAGYLTKPRGGLTVRAGKTTDVGDIIATRGVSVSGRVIDRVTRKPVRMNVGAWPTSYAGRGTSTINRPKTFVLRLLPGETYRIYAHNYGLTAETWDSGMQVRVPSRGRSGVEIEVEKNITGGGRVLDQSSRPLERSSVTASCFVGFYAAGTSGVAETDSKGRFEMTLASKRRPPKLPEHLALVVRDEKHRTEEVATAHRDEFLSGGVTLRVKPTITLEVRVLNKDTKRPIRNACVFYHNFWIKTDTGGLAQFRMNVRSGNCPVDVYKSYGKSHSHSTISLPDPKSKEWSDKVTVLLEPLTEG